MGSGVTPTSYHYRVGSPWRVPRSEPGSGTHAIGSRRRAFAPGPGIPTPHHIAGPRDRTAGLCALNARARRLVSVTSLRPSRSFREVQLVDEVRMP